MYRPYRAVQVEIANLGCNYFFHQEMKCYLSHLANPRRLPLEVMKEANPLDVIVYPLFSTIEPLGFLSSGIRATILGVPAAIPPVISAAIPPRSCNHLAQNRRRSRSHSSRAAAIALQPHPSPDIASAAFSATTAAAPQPLVALLSTAATVTASPVAFRCRHRRPCHLPHRAPIVTASSFTPPLTSPLLPSAPAAHSSVAAATSRACFLLIAISVLALFALLTSQPLPTVASPPLSLPHRPHSRCLQPEGKAFLPLPCSFVSSLLLSFPFPLPHCASTRDDVVAPLPSSSPPVTAATALNLRSPSSSLPLLLPLQGQHPRHAPPPPPPPPPPYFQPRPLITLICACSPRSRATINAAPSSIASVYLPAAPPTLLPSRVDVAPSEIDDATSTPSYHLPLLPSSTRQ
ncbi:hypothetical protein BHE74_00036632 [Ensete ventricosum]|nr:hypothetical protein BHE74_00036632 [Ensete ventricosum]